MKPHAPRPVTSAALLTLVVMAASSPSHAAINASGDTSPTNFPENGTVPFAVVGMQADGLLSITGNSDLSIMSLTAGGSRNVTGGIEVRDSGSTLTSSSIRLGSLGTGNLNISNGAAVTSYNINLGEISGSFGAIQVDGTGSSLTARTSLGIGFYGTGSLRITNGATANVNGITSLGNYPGGIGAIYLNSGGSLTTGSLYASTSQLTGSGTINTYGLVSDYNLVFDAQHGANQTITLNGADQNIALKLDLSGSIKAAGNLGAGYSSDSSITIRDGVAITTYSGILGIQTGVTGTANIIGAGSRWTNTSSLTIGSAGTGIVNISSGGEVRVNGATYVGINSGSSGRINFGAGGGTLSTQSLYASPNQIIGTGTINTRGLVSDLDLRFDATHGQQQTLALNGPGQSINLNLDLSGTTGTPGDLGVGYKSSASLMIADGVTVNSNTGYLGYKAGSAGTAYVNAATWNTTNDLNVGYYGTGQLTITQGATVKAGSLVLGLMNGSAGTVTVTDQASTLTIKDSLTVGSSGQSVLNIANGAKVSNALGTIGQSTGSTGTVNISGAGSKWTNSGNLVIGQNGTGILNISDGASVSAVGSTWLGQKEGSSGSLNFGTGGGTLTTGTLYASTNQITGTGTINTKGLYSNLDLVFDAAHAAAQSMAVPTDNGNLTFNLDMSGTVATYDLGVGYSGAGSLTVKDGIIVSTANSYVGYQANSSGTATVSGTGSTWNALSLYVGYSSNGTLNVTNGGTIKTSGTNYSYLGYNAGSVGTVNLNGANSSWTSTNYVVVGEYGTGQLNISNGAQTTFKSAWIGNSSNGTSKSAGTVSVSGNNSKLTVTNGLTVGSSGDGTLNLQTGGKVDVTGNTTVAESAGSTGAISVDGSGSNMWAGGYFILGNNGNATLNISNGGRVAHSSNAQIGYNKDSTGRATVDGPGSTWAISGYLQSGINGKGTVNIVAGGNVTANSGAYLGSGTGGNGAVTVDGPGSTLNTSSVNYVGYGGTGTLQVLNGANATTAGSNYIGTHAGSSGTVLVSGGSTWNSGSTIIGSEAGSVGSVSITGNGTTWSNAGALTIGNSGHGELNISSGARVSTVNGTSIGTSGQLNFGASGGTLSTQSLRGSMDQITGNGTINTRGLVSDVDLIFDQNQGVTRTIQLNDSAKNITINLDMSGTAATTSELGVGYTGSHSMTIKDGVTVASSYGYLGYNSGSSGTATVTGPGTAWKSSIYVGYGGIGNLHVDNGASVNGVVVGRLSGSSGYALFEGSGTAVTSGLGVGISGNGQVDIRNGVMIYGSMSVGSEAGSNGIVSISGPDTTWQSRGIQVGYSGNGQLDISNGVTVTNISQTDGASIGTNAGSHGVITLDGAGTTWTNQNTLRIGDYGTGKMVISNGATVTNALSTMGFYQGSSATVQVKGAGSTWTTGEISGAIFAVGYLGSGYLAIRDGGKVVSNYSSSAIASQSGSVGTVIVDGPNSVWSNSGSLKVGPSGKGLLNINNGGTVTAKDLLIGTSSILSMDVGKGSLLDVGTGSVTNNGVIRFSAAAQAIGGRAYTPVIAGSWAGTGTYQALGGKWNSASHQFVASEIAHASAGSGITIDRSQIQRILVTDESTGQKVGASFMNSATSANLTFTANQLSSDQTNGLNVAIGGGNTILAGWDFSISGYTSGNPVLLSMELGNGFAGTELTVWHYDSTNGWQNYANQIMDLSYDGLYANFTVTGFSGYAITANVPEPASLLMMLPAAWMIAANRRRKS